MKKSKKTSTSRRTESSRSHTGIALLFCFFIASVAVAIAMRQLILERSFREGNPSLKISTNPIVGIYRVTVPESNSPGQLISLELKDNRSAVLTQDHQDNQDPLVQNGSWSGDSNGTIIVTLGDKPYAFSFSPEDSGSLRLLNPDIKVWGAATLTLVKD